MRDAVNQLMAAIAERELAGALAARTPPPPSPPQPVYHFHPDCTLCCQLGRCHWCLDKPMSGQIAQAPDGYMYAMCVNHIAYFREVTRGRGIDLVGFDAFNPLDRAQQAVGLSPLLYVPTQKDIDRQNS